MADVNISYRDYDPNDPPHFNEWVKVPISTPPTVKQEDDHAPPAQKRSAPRWALIALPTAFVLMAVPLFLNRNKDQNKPAATVPDKSKPVVAVQLPQQPVPATGPPTNPAATPATNPAALPTTGATTTAGPPNGTPVTTVPGTGAPGTGAPGTVPTTGAPGTAGVQRKPLEPIGNTVPVNLSEWFVENVSVKQQIAPLNGMPAYKIRVKLNKAAQNDPIKVVVQNGTEVVATIPFKPGQDDDTEIVPYANDLKQVQARVDKSTDQGKSADVTPAKMPVVQPDSKEADTHTHTTNVNPASQHRNATHTEGQTAQGKALAAAKAKLKKMEKALAAANKRTQAGQEAVPPIPVVNPTSPAQPGPNATHGNGVPAPVGPPASTGVPPNPAATHPVNKPDAPPPPDNKPVKPGGAAAGNGTIPSTPKSNPQPNGGGTTSPDGNQKDKKPKTGEDKGSG